MEEELGHVRDWAVQDLETRWGGGFLPLALAHVNSTFLGCVEFLSRPTMAFVRLREAVELDAVLEVPVPVRFLFLLLGPSSANMDYHEIGRSISTLMSDKVSCFSI